MATTTTAIFLAPIFAPTCTPQGPSDEGVTCEGSNVVGIDWPNKYLRGNISVLANLKNLKTLYLHSDNF